MKKSIFILVLGLFLNLNLSAQLESVQNDIRYPIEEATVEYTLSMMGSDNTMIIYFKDYGKTQHS